MAYTTIDDPSAYFQATAYTGNGSADHAITNGGNSDLQPDLVWIKNRTSGTSDGHCLFDTSRGATKLLATDSDAVEVTDADTLDSFASDGFQVDADVKVNTNTETYVAWQWKCNEGTTETAVDESGDNPGNVRQTNTTAGFSMITYTGTGAVGTIAHGLGAVPHFILIKARSEASNNWAVYHQANTSAPETDFLRLDLNSATTDNANFMNDTAPTSSVFTVSTGSKVNTDAETYIAYVWTEKQGYSKFGGYTGNGDANGVFIPMSFKPAFFMWKIASGTGGWGMIDSTRDPINEGFYQLGPDDTDPDADYAIGDFLCNGMKMRNTFGDTNLDGGPHIYMAFAENPFVTSEGIPCTAR